MARSIGRIWNEADAGVSKRLNVCFEDIADAGSFREAKPAAAA